MIKATIGFSLIELMIVITIISILTVIGVPSYQQYVKRARFIDVITSVQPYKTAVSLALQQGFPPEELKIGTHGIPEEPQPNKHLASLRISDGVVIATGTALVGGATLVLTPNFDGSQWMTSGTCIEAQICNG